MPVLINQKTTTFLSIADSDGAVAGEWFEVPRNDRTHIPLSLSLQAGTVTWEIHGRNSPDDDAVILDSGSTDDAVSVLRMNQMRVALTASSGATFRATGDMPMREIEEL